MFLYLPPCLPPRSTLAIRILYQSRFTEMLSSCLDTLEDSAAQVGPNIGHRAARLGACTTPRAAYGVTPPAWALLLWART